jgi:hypothetical protein
MFSLACALKVTLIYNAPSSGRDSVNGATPSPNIPHHHLLISVILTYERFALTSARIITVANTPTKIPAINTMQSPHGHFRVRFYRIKTHY